MRKYILLLCQSTKYKVQVQCASCSYTKKCTNLDPIHHYILTYVYVFFLQNDNGSTQLLNHTYLKCHLFALARTRFLDKNDPASF